MSVEGAPQEELLEAVKTGDLVKARELLERDVSPNIPHTPNGLASAHYAAMNGDHAMLELLLEAGADVNTNNDMGTSVLRFAVQEYMHGDHESSLQMVKALTKDGRITNRDILGGSLSFSSGLGMTDIVKILLDAGADPDYFREEDDYCLTPLIGLIFENEEHENHVQIARMLVAAGANPRHVGRSGTALDYAEDYERDDMITVLKELMQ